MLDESSAAEIALAFGLGGEPRLAGPVAEGKLGRVWRLSTHRGSFAVKDPFFEVSVDDSEADASYQEAVLAGGVPMPAVVRSATGAVLVDVAGTWTRVYEWVDGVLPADRRLDPAAVGETLARIHRVVVPSDRPPDLWHTAALGADTWRSMVGELRAARCGFADQLADLVPAFLDCEDVLVAPSYTQWSHCDLWEDNLRGTASGDLVVLDWENSGPADPSQELGMVLFAFGCGESDRTRTLFDAYCDAGGPGRLRMRADLTMLVATLNHITAEGCRRWLRAETEEERAQNAAWVREGLDDPVTLDTIDHILASVSR